MGRRYGRNQKRRHREQLRQCQMEAEQIKAAYNMSNGLLSDTSRKLREREEQMREMVAEIEAICSYSVVIPPQQVKGDHRRDNYRIPVYERVPLVPMSLAPSIGLDTFRYVDTYALRCYLEDHREQFQTAVHLRYEGGGHEAYMLSRSALDVYLGRTDDLARQIARALATNMCNRGR